MLETLTRKQKLPITCEGCSNTSQSCQCKMEGVKINNLFQVYIIIGSRTNQYGTEWCPQNFLGSTFFNCYDKSEGNMTIRAEQVCDGFYDCDNKLDESKLVCSSFQLIVLIGSIIGGVFAAAISLAFYYSAVLGGEESDADDAKHKAEVAETLSLIAANRKNAGTDNEKIAKNKIEKLPEEAQIELISVANCIDIKGKERSGPILKTVVKQVYSADSKALNMSQLAVMKETEIPTGLKTTIISTKEQGAMARLNHSMKKSFPKRCRLVFGLAWDMCFSIYELAVSPIQSWKDLTAIILIYVFFNDILQQRVSLVDDVPLDHFVYYLMTVFIGTTAVKIISAANALDLKISNEINKYVLWIPFFTETFITIMKMKQTCAIFEQEWSIAQKVVDIEKALDETEQMNKWKEIVEKGRQINGIEMEKEQLIDSRKKITIISCIGDILQGVSITILLLYTDFKLYGALGLSKMTSIFGARPEDGTTGNYLTFFRLNLFRCYPLVDCSLEYDFPVTKVSNQFLSIKLINLSGFKALQGATSSHLSSRVFQSPLPTSLP